MLSAKSIGQLNILLESYNKVMNGLNNFHNRSICGMAAIEEGHRKMNEWISIGHLLDLLAVRYGLTGRSPATKRPEASAPAADGRSLPLTKTPSKIMRCGGMQPQ